MKSICAWCEAELPPTEGIDNQQITHGICDTCMLFYTAKKERLRDFINDFDQPIMIISNEGRVKTANNIALSAINKTLDDVIDQLGGDVMDCPHSKLPEGCGRTEHCTGCEVRNTVMETFSSKESRQRRAFMLFQGSDHKIKKVYYDITTEFANDIVMLRIDEVGEV